MSEMIKAFDLARDAVKREKEGKPAPMATCPACGEPLIATFKFRGKEFVCVECHKLWGFVDPTPVESTPELDARYQELKAKWDASVLADTQESE